MNFDLVRNFTQDEKIALLKMLLKVAYSDNKITRNEQETLKQYLAQHHLKITKDFILKSVSEDVECIVSAFTNKINLNRACKISSEFANMHGISPEHEALILNQIQTISDGKKKEIKFSLINSLKTFAMEFAFLWGKEDINPKYKNVLSIVFTVIACFLGSIYTVDHWWDGKSTAMVTPEFSAVMSGLLIFGALCFRGYFPKPNNARNLIFTVTNIYLLSIIAMHILGRGSFEKSITFTIFGGLILLLWLGMKEILGFAFIGFFIILIVKLVQMDIHMDWRAFPFIVSAFMGISFQSTNFFDNFNSLSSSFFKKPEVNKNLLKESLQKAGQQTLGATKQALVMGTEVAKLSAGGI